MPRDVREGVRQDVPANAAAANRHYFWIDPPEPKLAPSGAQRGPLPGGVPVGSMLKEFWLFLKQEKKWWLIPMIVVFVIVGGLVLFTKANAILAPFIYPLM